MSTHKIFHMASFSRSGETLLQRCLSAHPKIEVVHQILSADDPNDLELFKYLMNSEELEISSNHKLLQHRALKPGSILLLKNAVWCHKYPRNGFILIRNPFSVVASAYRVSPPPDQAERQKLQQVRWAKTIDQLLVKSMRNDPTRVGFLSLYSRKMLNDYNSGLGFVRYEDFVKEPEHWLRKIISTLGLDWDEGVLTSHENYRTGEKGHGGIDLSKPISCESNEKYKSIDPEVLSEIYGLTHEVLRLYGYSWDGNNVETSPVNKLL